MSVVYKVVEKARIKNTVLCVMMDKVECWEMCL